MFHTISDLRGVRHSMDWSVVNEWGVVVAQFDTWADAQMFRTAKDDAAKTV